MFYFTLDHKPVVTHRRGCALPKYPRFDVHPLGRGRAELSGRCSACGTDFAWSGRLVATPVPNTWNVEIPRLSTARLGAALYPRPAEA